MQAELHLALDKFRHDNGFGRAISAPQIDRHVQMIACNLGANAVHRPEDQPFTMCTPRDPFKFSPTRLDSIPSAHLHATYAHGACV